jgi:folylpolyglutamate synthase/dihydropteroate synthase
MNTPDADRIALLIERVQAHDAHAIKLFSIAAEKAGVVRDARVVLAQNENEKHTMLGWSEIPDGARLTRLRAELEIHVEALRRATDDWQRAEKIAKDAASDLEAARKA